MATVIQGWRPKPLALAPSQTAGILPRLQVAARLVPQVVVAVVVAAGGPAAQVCAALAVVVVVAAVVAGPEEIRVKVGAPASESFY